MAVPTESPSVPSPSARAEEAVPPHDRNAGAADVDLAQARFRLLAESSQLLGDSLDYEATLAALARLAVPRLADWCTVDVLEDGALRSLAVAHADPSKVAWARELAERYPPRLDDPTGAPNVLRTGRAEFYPYLPDALLVANARDPEHLRILREVGFTSVIVAPLVARGRTLGTFALVSAESGRRYTADDLTLAEDLGRRAGTAIDNARLYREAAEERHRLEAVLGRARFLAESATLLASSLDYQATLASVARLAVPRLADWCTVQIREDDGGIRTLAVAHVDPAKVAWARRLGEQYPVDPESPRGVPHVLRTGTTEWAAEIPDALLVESARDAEQLRILRELGFASYICAPLLAGGRALGAISFVTTAESGRRYDRNDVQLAEDLASRAAIAVDNARLYRERVRAEAEVRALNEGLERRVRERTAQLEEVNRELESFSYSVSHDLRAPVRHIGGFTRLLEQHAGPAFDERARHLVKTIGDSAAQCGRLIDDLLAFSRMARAEMRRIPVDTARLVEGARRDLEPETQGRAIEWRVGELPTVVGEPAMLALVWKNLLANAVKFTRHVAHAVIEVDARVMGDEVEFLVRDNGAGFDMEYRDKLFSAFQRLHRHDEFEGSGIGLANVRRIVLRHGGRVRAEGARGQGATFYFTLPRAERDGDA